MLDGTASLGFAFADAALREALGRPGPTRPLPAARPLLPLLRERTPAVLDLSVTSEALDEGRFLEPGCERELFAHAATARGVAIARYGEHRLTRSRVRSDREQETVALCVELVAAADQMVEAPWPGTVIAIADEGIELEHDGVRLLRLRSAAFLCRR